MFDFIKDAYERGQIIGRMAACNDILKETSAMAAQFENANDSLLFLKEFPKVIDKYFYENRNRQ